MQKYSETASSCPSQWGSSSVNFPGGNQENDPKGSIVQGFQDQEDLRRGPPANLHRRYRPIFLEAAGSARALESESFFWMPRWVEGVLFRVRQGGWPPDHPGPPQQPVSGLRLRHLRLRTGSRWPALQRPYGWHRRRPGETRALSLSSPPSWDLIPSLAPARRCRRAPLLAVSPQSSLVTLGSLAGPREREARLA